MNREFYRMLDRLNVRKLLSMLCVITFFTSCSQAGNRGELIDSTQDTTQVQTTLSESMTAEHSTTEPIPEDDVLAGKAWITSDVAEQNGVLTVETDEVVVSYVFSSDSRGMAGGEITVGNNTGKRHSVSLWWGNAKGRLSSYSSLGEFMVAAGKESTLAIHPMTMVPPTADRFLVVTENEIIVLLLAEERLFDGKLLYTFACGSDIHMKGQKLWNAAMFLKEYDISVFASAGDLTQSSSETTAESDREFSEILYTAKLAFGEIPFYSTKGNHDLWVSDSLWGETFETDSPLFYAKEIEGDLFVFIGMEGVTDPFVDGALDWLEELLKNNTDKRIYIFQHLFLIDTVSSLRGAQGQLLYPNVILMQTTNPEEIRFRSLINAYPNAIHFSGHSHWQYRLQRFDENANIYRENEISGTMVHIGSLGRPLTSDGISTRQEVHAEASEGMIVEVYDDCLIIKGIDFETMEFLSYACYLVPMTLDTSP